MLVTLAILATIQAAPAAAQSGPDHGHPPPGHTHGGGDADAQAAHRRVEAYLKEFDAVVGDGRGFGLAFAADQNGYPGPLHVLELKDRLQLTPEQEARMTSLFQTMLAEARAKAMRLAEAEARLRQVFAAGTADAAAVRAAVAGAEAARAEVRLVHLLTHLEARDLLTETQRRTYHHLRWGASKNH
jgi:Spy/CpxP family protein refolding chaperone